MLKNHKTRNQIQVLLAPVTGLILEMVDAINAVSCLFMLEMFQMAALLKDQNLTALVM